MARGGPGLGVATRLQRKSKPRVAGAAAEASGAPLSGVGAPANTSRTGTGHTMSYNLHASFAVRQFPELPSDDGDISDCRLLSVESPPGQDLLGC
jgi:hypothetical protein